MQKIPRLVGRIGSGVRVIANFHNEPYAFLFFLQCEAYSLSVSAKITDRHGLSANIDPRIDIRAPVAKTTYRYYACSSCEHRSVVICRRSRIDSTQREHTSAKV